MGLIEIDPDKNSTSLICSALVAYPAQELLLYLSAKQRRFLTDQERTLLGILQGGSVEMEIEGLDAELENDISRYRLTSSEEAPFQPVIPHTSLSSSQK